MTGYELHNLLRDAGLAPDVHWNNAGTPYQNKVCDLCLELPAYTQAEFDEANDKTFRDAKRTAWEAAEERYEDKLADERKDAYDRGFNEGRESIDIRVST